MHIITGMIGAALLSGGTSQKKSPLLRLKGVIETRHLIPGRVRFYLPGLVYNKEWKSIIEKQIAGIKGIQSLQVEMVTGTVLIYYKDDVLEAELLFAALVRLLGLEKEIINRKPLIAKEIRHIARALNHAIYEQSHGIIDLWTAIPIVLLGLGVHQMVTRKQNNFPGGFTLLWWAYNGLTRRLSGES